MRNVTRVFVSMVLILSTLGLEAQEGIHFQPIPNDPIVSPQAQRLLEACLLSFERTDLDPIEKTSLAADLLVAWGKRPLSKGLGSLRAKAVEEILGEPPSPFVARVSAKILRSFIDSGNPSQAIEFLGKVFQNARETGDSGRKGVSKRLFELRCRLALEILEKWGKSKAVRIGEIDPLHGAILRVGLQVRAAKKSFFRGETSRVRELLAEALEILRNDQKPHDLPQGEFLLEIARILVEIDEIDAAREILNRAEVIGLQNESNNGRREILPRVAVIFAAIGDTGRAREILLLVPPCQERIDAVVNILDKAAEGDGFSTVISRFDSLLPTQGVPAVQGLMCQAKWEILKGNPKRGDQLLRLGMSRALREPDPNEKIRILLTAGSYASRLPNSQEIRKFMGGMMGCFRTDIENSSSNDPLDTLVSVPLIAQAIPIFQRAGLKSEAARLFRIGWEMAEAVPDIFQRVDLLCRIALETPSEERSRLLIPFAAITVSVGSDDQPFNSRAKALAMIARTLQKLGYPSEARETIFRVLELTPRISQPLDKAEGLTEAGEFLLTVGEDESARKCMEEALSIIEKLGWAEEREETLAEIGGAFLLLDRPETTQLILDSLQVSALRASLAHQLGQWHLAARNFASARKFASLIEKEIPGNSPGLDRALAALMGARLRFSLGDSAAGLLLLNEAAKESARVSNPTTRAMLLSEMAEVHLSNRIENRVAGFADRIEDPDLAAKFRRHLASAQRKLGRTEESDEILESLLEDPFSKTNPRFGFLVCEALAENAILSGARSRASSLIEKSLSIALRFSGVSERIEALGVIARLYLEIGDEVKTGEILAMGEDEIARKVSPSARLRHQAKMASLFLRSGLPFETGCTGAVCGVVPESGF